VPVNPGADFSLLGRVADSLYFEVSAAVSVNAGFRYDLVLDLAMESEDLSSGAQVV